MIFKGNQPNLYRAAQQSFVISMNFQKRINGPHLKRRAREQMRSAFTLEESRGRTERRTLSTSTHDLESANWPSSGQCLRLEQSVTVHGETTTTVQYAITSLSLDHASPELPPDLCHGCWDIENCLSWGCDVVFGEDASRIRYGTAPLSMSPIKHIAMNTFCARKVPDLIAALSENALNVPNLLHKYKLGIATK